MIKTTTFNNTPERKIFIILSMSIVFSMFLYVFFIGVMSVSAGEMNGVSKEIRETGAGVSEMEEEYMSLANNITLSYAYSLGFKDPQVITFATRKTFAINFGNER